MVISHKYKFLCINIPKTASGTKENILRNYADIITNDKGTALMYLPSCMPYDFFIKAKNPRHTTAKIAYQEFLARGWNWNKYFKFALVRNPFDRYLSYFRMICMQKNKTMTAIDFKEWLLLAFKEEPAIIQSEYYTDKNGKIILDYISEYEKLDEELGFISSKLGIPLGPIQNPESVPKGGRNYNHLEYYDDQLHKLVMQKEKDVMQLKGYKIKTKNQNA